MTKYTVKVLKAHFINHNVKRIVVEKPKAYEFLAGQAAEIAIDEPGFRNITRPYTITSVSESDFLEFFIKVSTNPVTISGRLGNVNRGDDLIISNAFGNIRYRGPGLFIAGGTGITPFIAICRQLSLSNSLNNCFLLLANKTVRDIILKDELEDLFETGYVDVLEDRAGSNAEPGFLGSKLLREYEQSPGAYYYICGPIKFTLIIIKHLINMGVDESRIIYEKKYVHISLQTSKFINSGTI
jgi:ferredoxin-NADP reductase